MVEDDERVRQLTITRLKLIGYQVLEASDGPKALDILTRDRAVDLVFTDLIMPGGMSGGQVAARARQLRPGIKVLLTSGYAEELVHGDDLEREQLKVLRKPYHQADLVAALREAFASGTYANHRGPRPSTPLIAIKARVGDRHHMVVESAGRASERRFDPHQTMMVPRMEKIAEPLISFPSDAGLPLTEQPKLRFAVGNFDNWSQVRVALRDLHVRGLVLDSFNCLGLKRVFTGMSIVAPDQELVTVRPLPFPDSSEIVGCTSGPLADCLLERLEAGASSLKCAFGLWLIPRHAAHFQGAVRAGKILLWIRVAGADDERRACQSLLAHSSNSVGVHDLVLPGEQ